MMPSKLFHVYANRSNIGDWLSAIGIQSTLTPTTDLLCDGPFVETTLAVLEQMADRDRLVIGGGGLLMNYFEPFWRGLSQRSISRCTLWGVGVCDTRDQNTPPDRKLMQELVDRCERVVVRDELTRDFLDRDLPIVACPSLLAIQTLAAPGASADSVLHVDNFTTVGEDVFTTMDTMASSFAVSRGMKMRNANNRITPNSRTELDAMLKRYATAQVVLSSGLHGCIIAVALGKPIVAVAGDLKVDGFMCLAGLADWVVAPSELARVPAMLETVVAHQPSRSGWVQTMQQQNRDIGHAVEASP